MTDIVCLLLALAAAPGGRSVESSAFVLRGFDDFELDGRIEASGPLADQERAVVLVHGSGAQSMDSDFAAVTQGGEPNPFFVDLGAALNAAGFAVVRYHKRSYVLQQRAQRDPAYAQSDEVRAFQEDPLLALVEDAKACVDHARGAMPGAELFLLGHSQGTYIALQAAHEKPEVSGVALIGFANTPMSFLHFEQLVYRSLRGFRALDRDQSETLDATELEADAPLAASLRAQLAFLDSDADGALTRLEFQAASLTALIHSDPFGGAYLRREASYPRIPEVLRAARFEVVFLQGLLDNQTAAYHAKAIELVNRVQWRKQNLHFAYFEGLGHALDPRDDYDDLVYRRADPDALARAASLLDEHFPRGGDDEHKK